MAEIFHARVTGTPMNVKLRLKGKAQEALTKYLKKDISLMILKHDEAKKAVNEDHEEVVHDNSKVHYI